ncbi:lysylphosphatidylglycerol synthase domain-containing protein [Xylophilus sp.]|uniref:lysylphosphatidylglycerol synthase domain-containing protein n=1 Tax=Xylophilus sp. TaxID=2653893 RepID=UPI0013B9A82C|nr:lysylphosphatidylglycerol synthase domain-containing protein [Xylophilus sp.]KAF1048997.1 MAG: Inner membrane protein YbhN [Xylophilus sp.]
MASHPATRLHQRRRHDGGWMSTLHGLRERLWWPWVTRSLAAAFLLFVAWLIAHQARAVDWSGVGRSMQALPAPVLALAVALGLASHLAYSSFDLIGRHCTGHHLPAPTTMGITLVSYPCTLNLGSLIGGVGVRYRLYARKGLNPGTIGQIVVTSVVTNWAGYFLLACAVLWTWQPPATGDWTLPAASLRWTGAALALVSLAYIALCVRRGGRPLALRGRTLPLPGWRMALLQVAVSMGNWCLMASSLWMLLQGRAPFVAVLAVILFGAVAGLVSRVPAGLGVLEAVGVALLGPVAGRNKVLAAMLAYRALYYFAPLLLAGIAFAWAELRWRRSPHPAQG